MGDRRVIGDRRQHSKDHMQQKTQKSNSARKIQFGRQSAASATSASTAAPTSAPTRHTRRRRAHSARSMAKERIGLVYGAGVSASWGELGALGAGATAARVTGIIPAFLSKEGAYGCAMADELIVVDDMHQRKEADVRQVGRLRGAAGRHRHAGGAGGAADLGPARPPHQADRARQPIDDFYAPFLTLIRHMQGRGLHPPRDGRALLHGWSAPRTWWPPSSPAAKDAAQCRSRGRCHGQREVLGAWIFGWVEKTLLRRCSGGTVPPGAIAE